MKTYYLIIAAAVRITPKTMFYKIAVGISKIDQKECRFLKEYANRHGYYFSVWNYAASDFVEKIANSLSMAVYDLQMMACNVVQLARFIRQNKAMPDNKPLSFSAAFARQILNPSALFNRQIDVLRKAEAKRRNKPKANSIGISSLN